jgi:hypothetical protein
LSTEIAPRDITSRTGLLASAMASSVFGTT